MHTAELGSSGLHKATQRLRKHKGLLTIISLEHGKCTSRSTLFKNKQCVGIRQI